MKHPGQPCERWWCGHPLDQHRGLRCRVCGADCGVDCQRELQIAQGLAPTRAREKEIHAERMAQWEKTRVEQGELAL